MKLVCLNSNFYNKYLDKEEILKKQNRPYVIFVVNINNIDWAIPFRTNIRHKYAYMTEKINNNGIDYKIKSNAKNVCSKWKKYIIVAS